MKKYNYDVALISVTDTETVAVMKMHHWQQRQFENDQQVYFESLFEKNGQK